MINKIRALLKLVLDKTLHITADPPLQIDSQTKINNLNADLLDGYHATDLMNTMNVYRKQLTSTDIGNKFITLPTAPTDATKTLLFINGSPHQTYNVDYTVIGQDINWSGYPLETILQINDWITVLYK